MVIFSGSGIFLVGLRLYLLGLSVWSKRGIRIFGMICAHRSAHLIDHVNGRFIQNRYAPPRGGDQGMAAEPTPPKATSSRPITAPKGGNL